MEAAYLLDRSRIRIVREGKELDFRAFFQEASTLEKGFEFRYVVYKDLRERGYYVQPGRPDFRVYPRGGIVERARLSFMFWLYRNACFYHLRISSSPCAWRVK